MKISNLIIAASFVVLGALSVSATAEARHCRSSCFNVNVGSNYWAPAPVYVAPQPVYVAPQPVYVAPQPVYVAPAYYPAPVYAYPTRPASSVGFSFGFGSSCCR